MNATICSVGAYLPPKRVTNNDLALMIDTSDEWIRSHTGIGSRHLAENETTSEMATAAAMQALSNSDICADELDMIIVSTSTPDYIGFPATASIVQHNIGATRSGAFDLGAACTGFVYALECGRGLISSGVARNVLVIGAEKLSSLINWKDRSTCVLFGDGAGAVLLSVCEDDRGFLASRLRSDGSGAEALIVRAGGTKNPIRGQSIPEEDLYISMDGRRVYNFAVQVNTELFQFLPSEAGISIDEIKYIVPHQANVRIIKAAAKRAGIPLEKFYLNIEEYANTSAASIPIALNDLWQNRQLKTGDIVLTLGFGSGLTYGGQLIRL
ncbi:beta-ketoacyl-ACP synthase III [Marispirochaeta sp.]|jgi:3-oxoacyl-[acyl-carrier-protein] synthase III|uniref:beta-ketoacyl-ACP synthase III n=1 Tax=Marispirochaeta sp. TaxID=2038653 RepID=UPI0029C761D9|nr:beta-ketoacyl-ACP synthase III [Marispirochaeta sp.]